MADLPQIGPQETQEPPTAPPLPKDDDLHYTAKPFAPLVGFLDIGESEMSNKNQTLLNEIWDYLGNETKSEQITERLHALRILENRLSPPRIGQSRLTRIHSYIQAQRAVQQAENYRNSHLRGEIGSA